MSVGSQAVRYSKENEGVIDERNDSTRSDVALNPDIHTIICGADVAASDSVRAHDAPGKHCKPHECEEGDDELVLIKDCANTEEE